MSLLKIVGVLAGAVALVMLCNANGGVLVPISGVPWVVLLVIAVLIGWSFLLGRTKLGRYMYAIGGNAEAARRAAGNVAWLRTVAFSSRSCCPEASGRS